MTSMHQCYVVLFGPIILWVGTNLSDACTAGEEFGRERCRIETWVGSQSYDVYIWMDGKWGKQ